MKSAIPMLLFALAGSTLWAQDQQVYLEMKLNSDTVGTEDRLRVSVTAHNVDQADFGKMEFPGFRVSGPSRQSSVQVINGNKTSQITEEYYLFPEAQGTFFIEGLTADTDQGPLSCEGKQVVVVEGKFLPTMQQERNMFDNFWRDRRSFFDSFTDPFDSRPYNRPPKKKFEGKVYRM